MNDVDGPLPTRGTEVAVARRKARLLAGFVDALIPEAVILLVRLMAFGSITHHITVLVGCLEALGQALYQVAFAMRRGDRRGQTIGKQLLKIRIVRVGGQPVRVNDLVLREFARGVLGAAGYFSYSLVFLLDLIDPGWILTNKANRALHDRLSGTIVVKAPDSRIRRSDDRLWEAAVGELLSAEAVAGPIRLRGLVSPGASAADQLMKISMVDRRFGSDVLGARLERIVEGWEQQSCEESADLLSEVASDVAVEMLLHGPAHDPPLRVIVRAARVDDWTAVGLEVSAVPHIRIAIVVSGVVDVVWDRSSIRVAGDGKTRQPVSMDWVLALHRDPGARWQLMSASSPIPLITDTTASTFS